MLSFGEGEVCLAMSVIHVNVGRVCGDSSRRTGLSALS